MESNWRKSSTRRQRRECVEVASAAGSVLVRDTTARTGPALVFTAEAWRAFISTVE